MNHVLLLLILCAIAAFWLNIFTKLAALLYKLYFSLHSLLVIKIGGYTFGNTPRTFITLFAVPLILAGLVRIAYWLLKRQSSAVIPGVIWGTWLVMVTLLATHAA